MPYYRKKRPYRRKYRKKKSFKKAVKSVMFKTLETKHYSVTQNEYQVATSTWDVDDAPISIGQGTDSIERVGNLVFLKNLTFRGALRADSGVTGNRKVRVVAGWVKEAATTANFNVGFLNNAPHDLMYVMHDKVYNIGPTSSINEQKYIKFNVKLNRRLFFDGTSATGYAGAHFAICTRTDEPTSRPHLSYVVSYTWKDI